MGGKMGGVIECSRDLSAQMEDVSVSGSLYNM